MATPGAPTMVGRDGTPPTTRSSQASNPLAPTHGSGRLGLVTMMRHARDDDIHAP